VTSALSSLGFSSTPLNDLFHVRGSGEIAVSDLKCRQLSAGSFAPQCGKRDTKFFRRVPERQRDKSFATLTHNSTQPYGCIPFPPYFKAQLSYAPVSTGIGWVSRNNYTGRLCLVLHITGLRSECFGPADSWSDISTRSEKGQSHDRGGAPGRVVLPAEKCRTALFDKGRHALASIMGWHDPRKCGFLNRQAIVNRRIHAAMNCH